MNVRSEIVTQVTAIAQQQGKRLAPLTDDLLLLNSGLDSLCIALLVARLEDEFDVDPFSSGDDVEIPLTFGELVRLYENATV